MANPLYGQNKFDGQADNKCGEIIHVEATSDGTIVSPTATLTASNAGNVYMCDISDGTAAFVLPTCADVKGMEVTFILDISSDTEASKDLMIASASTTEFIIGPCHDGGTIHEADVDNDQIIFDTSSGAAGGGDRIKLLCDGRHWYVLDCTTLTAGALVSGTATRS